MPLQWKKHLTRPTEAPNFDSALNTLFFAAFPLVLWLFQGSGASMTAAFLVMVPLWLGLRMISSGQKHQFDYLKTQTARHPKTPRKLLGSLILGVAVFILAGLQIPSFPLNVSLGILATVLSIQAFGLDPMADRPGKNSDDDSTAPDADDTLRAEKLALMRIEDKISKLNDADLAHKTEEFSALVIRQLDRKMPKRAKPQRAEKLVSKCIGILDAETRNLLDRWETDKAAFARRRYVLKLQILSDAISQLATPDKPAAANDAFDRKAEELIKRMPEKSVA